MGKIPLLVSASGFFCSYAHPSNVPLEPKVDSFKRAGFYNVLPASWAPCQEKCYDHGESRFLFCLSSTLTDFYTFFS